MAVKTLAVVVTLLFSSAHSHAGWNFWPFKSATKTVPVQHMSQSEWDDLSDAEQAALLKQYQALKALPNHESDALQQRMDWFSQLSEQDKQKMREIWQKMSSADRKDLRQRMQRAATAEQRVAIRSEYMRKYEPLAERVYQ